MIAEFEKYQILLSGSGRDELVSAVRAFRESYGKNWMEEFKRQNPDYILIVDLAANYDFPAAFVKLKAFIAERLLDQEPHYFKRQALSITAGVFIEGARGDLETLHGFLKAEIDRPRF